MTAFTRLCTLFLILPLAIHASPAPAAEVTPTPAPAATPTPAPEVKDATPPPAAPPAEPLPTLKPVNTDPNASDFQEIDATDKTKPTVSYTKTATTDNAAAFEAVDIQKNVIPDPEKIELPPQEEKKPLTQEESDKRLAKMEEEKKATLANEKKKEEEKTAAAAKEVDLFEYNLTGLKEAGVDVTKNGFGVTAKIGLFDGQYLRSTFAVNTDGFFAQGYMNQLKLGKVLTITGKGPDGTYGTADDGAIIEIKINSKVQQFTISGLIDFLGAMSESEVIISPEFISVLSKTNLFGMYKTIFLAEFKPTDLDFLIAAAIEVTLMQYIQDQVSAALAKGGEAISDLGKKGERDIAKAQEELAKFESQINDLTSKIEQAKNDMLTETTDAQKQVDKATKEVEDAEESIARELGKIMEARQKLLDGRKKITDAQDKVNSLSSETDYAYSKMKSLSRMKWYEVAWKGPELVYWSARYAAVQAARGYAVGYLEVVKGIMRPLSEVLTATYAVSYATSKAWLFTAYAALKAARVAANPGTLVSLGKMIGYSIALTEARLGYYAAQGALIIGQGASIATDQIGQGVAIASKALVSSVIGGVFRIDGGGFKALFSDLRKGILDLYLIASVFGTRKNLKISLDMGHPDKMLASIGNMILDIINPSSSGSSTNVFEDIEAARKKFAPQLAELEAKKEEVLQEKAALIQQQAERDAAVASISAEVDKEIAQAYKKYPMSAEDIKAMGSSTFANKDESASIVDESNPVNYTLNNMKGTFRWLEKWKLKKPDSGSVIFDVVGTSDVCIGFHHTVEAKDQKTNKDCDVVLGSETNTKTVTHNSAGVVELSTSNPDFLLVPPQDQSIQSFWVSFDRGYIAVGRGRTPGQSFLFDWYVNKLTDPIQYFSFSSAQNQLSFSNITTGDAYSKPFGSQYSTQGAFGQCFWFEQLKLPTPDSGTITFNARAKDNIIIGFTDSPDNPTPRFFATIGTDDNKKTTLSTTAADGKSSFFAAVTQDPQGLIKDPQGLNPYWITYHNGHLVLGSGSTPSQNCIAETVISLPAPADTAKTSQPITHYSFSSWESDVFIQDIKVQPAVPAPLGTRHSAVNKKFACEWKKYWSLPEPGRGAVTWQGKGSSDMAVALHTTADGKPEDFTLMCVIGGSGNTVTTLKDSSQKVVTQTTDPASTITDQSSYKSYWLTYDNGYCMLGTGDKPGENITLEYPGTPAPITHVSFTNNAGFVEYKTIAISTLATEGTTKGKQFSAAPQSAPFFHPQWTFLKGAAETAVLFTAKTKSGFTLHFASEDKKDSPYTLVYGGKTGKEISLAGPAGESLFHTDLAKPCINDSYNFYPYWVTYTATTGALSFGSGIQTGKNILATGTLAPGLSLFGVSNGSDSYAYLKQIGIFASGDPAIMTQYKNTAALSVFNIGEKQEGTVTYTWNPEWKLAEPNSLTLSFSTKAPDTIAVGLGNETIGAVYEVVFGAGGNTESLIMKDKTIVEQTVDTTGLIPDRDNSYPYWVHFYKGLIQVGSGSTPQQNILMEWQDEKAGKDITHFSVSSDTSDVVFQNITQTPGSKLPLYQNYSACKEGGAYNWLAPWQLAKPESGCISFEVKSQKGAALIGLGKPGTAIYTFSLGDSCSLSKQGSVLASNNTVKVSDTEFKPFWIIYDKGYCALGSGYTPSQDTLILEYQDLVVLDVIQNFSLSSSTGQATYHAVQSIPLSTAQFARNTTCSANGQRKNYALSKTWSLAAANSGTLLFDATGEGPYYIALDDRLGGIVNPRLEVIIGSDTNTQTQLRKNGVQVEGVSDPRGIISISKTPTPYWVTIKDNTVSVGAGKDPSKNTFLSWVDAAPEPVTFFSFSSDKTNVLYKHIQSIPAVQQEAIASYVLAAKGNQCLFDKAWKLSAPESGSISFKAKGKSDIVVGLSHGMNNKPSYEVVIGGEGNTGTFIRMDGQVVARIDSQESLIRNSMVPIDYWVSYTNGCIAVGLGANPGEKTTLLWADKDIAQKKENPITHFAFSNKDAMITLQDIAIKKGISLSPDSLFTSSGQNGSFVWNPNWRIQPGQTIAFEATAPHADLYVGLSASVAQNASYTCRIGGWKNTQTTISVGSDITAQTADKLNTVSEKLWIRYLANCITIGTGEPHTTEILNLNLKTPDATMKFFTFASGTSSLLCENIRVVPADKSQNPKTEPVIPAIQITAPAPAASLPQPSPAVLNALTTGTPAAK